MASDLGPFERLMLTLACVMTLFFVVVTPPFQAPDENQHYMKALLLSQGQVLTSHRGAMIGAVLPNAALDIHAVDFPTDPDGRVQLYTLAMLAKSWSADAARPGERFADFPNVASYAPTLYAPGAAGLMLGEAVGLPRLGAFYMGRLVNALTALALLFAALRIMPFGRLAMLAVALLPTFAYQNGSLSSDAVINGIGFLGLAIALRIGAQGANTGGTTVATLTAPVLALAKGVYLPLMAAGLRWPLWRGRSNWTLLAVMALGAGVFIVWMRYSGGSQALYHIASRKTGETMMTAPLAEQLRVILNDPVGFVHILVTSVADRSPVYALQMVGRFGWNAILLPLVAYPVAGIMLAAAVLSGAQERFDMGQRIWWLMVAAGVAILIETAMYLTGTPYAADYIQGTQGRYFLPVLPLALLALMPHYGLGNGPRIMGLAACVLSLIAAASALDSFWWHGFITSDGMPPYDGIGAALLLPSPRW